MKLTKNMVVLMAPLLLFQPACAAVLRSLPQVIQYVQDAQMILDMIDSQASPFFERFADEKVKEEYSRSMMTAQQTLQVALRSAKGTDELSKEQIDEAFTNFREAYKDLLAVLRRAGALSADGALKASPDAPAINVPEPLAVSQKE